MEKCFICPRNCNVRRPNGFCGMPEQARIARAEVHYYEEPCICDKNGSGTVFFCGCNMRCEFCQNEIISRKDFSDYVDVTIEQLKSIYQNLQEKKVNNINLVTPSHYTHIIAESLNNTGLKIPAIYNSNGYDKVEQIQELKGKINIYMPDLKYVDSDIAKKYSHTPNYFEYASKAIDEMYSQVGKAIYNENGMLQNGLIIRHLVLPNNIQNSIDVIDYIYDTFPRDNVIVSLMGQYTPPTDESFAMEFPELSSQLSIEEYEIVAEYFKKRKLNGYLQFPAKEEKKYIPSFGKDFIIDY